MLYIREVFAMAARIYTGCLQYIVFFVCELPFFSVIGGQVLPHCSFIYLWFSKNESENTAAVHHFFLNLVPTCVHVLVVLHEKPELL